ncbi:hypothetical protein DTO207G8_3272 [Paecilomyces variotii]|nr:hypothetical protein DTO032I3_2278 [Paecilomyces variotii]KAJ9236260.1 hypothetical protein DTO169E5_5817 [Paecilomyces variotii]KAJ9255088.1 hypothetical protein DTO207G8_3272 [Paecilomyces variotii]KAJ9282016.1 hypothetical protein DTO021D3_1312 [Paecilomyces variotii]KAJ9342019.1 hypothetical protein DTO027B6_5466 [Paecilomyces variotii]
MTGASKPKQIKQIGVTEVYRSQAEKPLVDIVFVHGLNGHPKDTWTSRNTDVFWPGDLLPEILEPYRVRILTYGYNANVTAFTEGTSKDRIHHHAETLGADLSANRNLRGASENPIIFVCHSLGGLIVKRALIYCRSVANEKLEHLRSIYVSTYGILFLGTPHEGSDIAKWGLLLQNICSAVLPKRFMDSSPQLIKALKSDSETLQNISRLFVDIQPRFRIYFFHETKPTDLKGTRELIVDERSAAPNFDGVERMGIEADHSHMCKFDDEDAPGYEAVADALIRYARDAPAFIANRWVQEKRELMLARKARADEIYNGGRDTAFTGSMPDIGQKGTPNTYPPRPASEGINSPLSWSLELPTQQSPLFVVPPGFHPNAFFVGMEKELKELHSRLFKAKKRAERVTAVLICGGPGSGKSQLAREYIYTHRQEYPGGVFWIDAKSLQSTSNCFWDIAQAAALVDDHEFGNPDLRNADRYVEIVRNWFQSREEWLLVFDGLTFDKDEDINDFKQFLPFNKNSSIIYTSINRTLRKKQRLFEPYCLMVQPLKVEEACKLLFKDLGIKLPTIKQRQKAKELAEYYQCLPLAIHAIGHRLNASSKPIETYQINSHLTDEKLAEPYLIIMNDLWVNKHYEALNLINLLSFLGHHVPVGLLTLGKSELDAFNVQIMTSIHAGEPGDLDNTFAVLIRYGLIERGPDHYNLKRKSPTFGGAGEDLPDVKAVAPDLSESQTDGSLETMVSSVYRSAIDVIKIHSVVQRFCRDELILMDDEQRQLPNSQRRSPDRGMQDAGFHDSWLVVATRVFCKSYENASMKMRDSKDSGLVKDYREYETHAGTLAEHFSKKKLSVSPPIVREARELLKQVVKSIKKDIQRISPSSSQESFRHQKSIFDRSSSSSSFPESSSADEGPVRWDGSETGSIRVESPQEMRPSHRVRLDPFPPHIYRGSSQEPDAGYETDGEGRRRAHGTSPTLSQITEKPTPPASSPPQSSEEQGWEVVHRPRSKIPIPARSSRPKGRRTSRDLGQFRPKPALTKLSSVQCKGAVRDPISAPISRAEASLAAMHLPSRRGSQPITRGQLHKSNSVTYATIAAGPSRGRGRARTLSSRGSSPSPASAALARSAMPLRNHSSGDSLRSRSSNVQSSPFSAEAKLSHSAHSESGLALPGSSPRTLEPVSAPGSRRHSRQGSSSRSVDITRELSSGFSPGVLPPLPYDEEISITRRQHAGSTSMSPVTSPPMRSRSPVPHPSAILPGASPTHIPGGYTSEPPISDGEPMSRGPSAQSTQSWHTDPTNIRYQPAGTAIPTIGPAIPATPLNGPSQFIPQPQLLSGTGGWAGNGNENVLQPEAAYIPQDVRAAHLSGQWTRFQYGGEPESLYPSDLAYSLHDPRRRLQNYGPVQEGGLPRHIPTHNPGVSVVSPAVSSTSSPQIPFARGSAVRRARSGSSPSRGISGLGLRM